MSREDHHAETDVEDLAKRVDEFERELAEHNAASIKDWRLAAGMFTGSECSRQIDEEARKIREGDRDAARREFGE